MAHVQMGGIFKTFHVIFASILGSLNIMREVPVSLIRSGPFILSPKPSITYVKSGVETITGGLFVECCRLSFEKGVQAERNLSLEKLWVVTIFFFVSFLVRLF